MAENLKELSLAQGFVHERLNEDCELIYEINLR